jgi:CBS domain-containing protein
MKVEQLMTRTVQACRRWDSLNQAARIMWDQDCGCVPVVDDQRHVVGIVTDRDICMAAYTRGLPLWALQVDGAMAHEVHTCRPGDTLAAAERTMRAHQLHRLPVVDEAGVLVGLLSLRDLAVEATREHGRRRAEVSAEEVAETLGAVCQPRGEHALAPAA